MSEAFPGVADALQRCKCRLSEFHREPARAQIAPELLAKQSLYIGLVVDHKNEKAHLRPPDLAMDAAVRGSVILNSVNSPGCVSTSIDPECCFTTMS